MTYKAYILCNYVVVEDKDAINELYHKKSFGWFDEKEKNLKLSYIEAFYLLKKNKLEIYKSRDSMLRKNGKPLTDNAFRKYGKQLDNDFDIKNEVYKNLRDRGYIVKSGLKYGTHFRVYDRGIKPKKGERSAIEHARYLVHATTEDMSYSIPEIARIIRLAHSVKKKFWLAVLDNEGDITYFQMMRIVP